MKSIRLIIPRYILLERIDTMHNRLAGIMLGTAVGDSLGLPAEGLSPRRRKRLMPGPWRQRLLFGRGMMSDDTEHTLFVAQSLLRHPDNASAFQRRLAWYLRWWLASLPAGVGKATAKACLKLWLGFSPVRSGVFSAGNGPAMRRAVLGGYFFDRPEMIEKYVSASTRLTHTDPRREAGAKAIAKVAAWAVMHSPTEKPPIDGIMAMLREVVPADDEWNKWIGCIQEASRKNVSVLDFAVSQGMETGVSGYIYHTVPVALYAWIKHYGDFRLTLEAALDCGGDADTVGAIAGTLAGATVAPTEFRLTGFTASSIGPDQSVCSTVSPIGCQISKEPKNRSVKSLISGRLSYRGTSFFCSLFCSTAFAVWHRPIDRKLYSVALTFCRTSG